MSRFIPKAAVAEERYRQMRSAQMVKDQMRSNLERAQKTAIAEISHSMGMQVAEIFGYTAFATTPSPGDDGTLTIAKLMEAKAKLEGERPSDFAIVGGLGSKEMLMRKLPNPWVPLVSAPVNLLGAPLMELVGMPEDVFLAFRDRETAEAWMSHVRTCHAMGIDVGPMIQETLDRARPTSDKVEKTEVED